MQTASKMQAAILAGYLLALLFHPEDRGSTSSKTLVNSYQITWHHILVDRTLLRHKQICTVTGKTKGNIIKDA
jgi:hypothetical protein